MKTIPSTEKVDKTFTISFTEAIKYFPNYLSSMSQPFYSTILEIVNKGFLHGQDGHTTHFLFCFWQPAYLLQTPWSLQAHSIHVIEF